MKPLFLPAVAGIATCLLVGCTSLAPDHRRAGDVSSTKPVLPPLPTGVTELKFKEFFVTPVGPGGLVVTEKLAGLDSRRVRLLGYMVKQEGGLSGRFLFAAIPVQLHDHDSELADDLPAATVFVTVPTYRDRPVPHAPGLMLLTGTLSVGQRDEADGRTSVVRLALDPPAHGAGKNSTGTGKGAGLTSIRPAAAR